MEISVLGSEGFVLGFRLSGVMQAIVCNDENFAYQFECALQENGVGVIIVEGEKFEKLPQYTKRKVEKIISPVVVPISADESVGTDIKQLIKRCLGIDLWK